MDRTDTISACEIIVALLSCYFPYQFHIYFSFSIFSLTLLSFLTSLPFLYPRLHFPLSLALSQFSIPLSSIATLHLPQSSINQTQPKENPLRFCPSGGAAFRSGVATEVNYGRPSILHTRKWSIGPGHKNLQVADVHQSSPGVLAILLQHTAPILSPPYFLCDKWKNNN